MGVSEIAAILSCKLEFERILTVRTGKTLTATLTREQPSTQAGCEVTSANRETTDTSVPTLSKEKRSTRSDIFRALQACQKTPGDEQLKALSSTLGRLPRWARQLLIPLPPPHGKMLYDEQSLANRSDIEGLSAEDEAVENIFSSAALQSGCWGSGFRMAVMGAERGDTAALDLQPPSEDELYWGGNPYPYRPGRRKLQVNFSDYKVKSVLKFLCLGYLGKSNR
mmetsp:Transcript_17629/g.50495  ORF Transcript_17629/g.50495 Transcript_17629/m.50495 type:complete len:224 (+) Transcript_17629:270-941(+)